MKILDIGCGKNKYKSKNAEDIVVGLDFFKLDDVDIVCDLEKHLPFKDDEFDIVIAKHSIEHVNNIVALMGEIHRILKPNGILKVIVPHFTNPMAYHFAHKSYFSYYSLNCFTEDSNESYYSKKKFDVVDIKFRLFLPMFNWFANKFPLFYETWFSSFVRCAEITYVLKARK